MSQEDRGNKADEFGMVERNVAEHRANFFLRRAGAIPPRLGDVQIVGAVLRDNFGQPSSPEEFELLLPYPRAVLAGLSFPVPVRSAQVSAARMALEQNGLAGQCAQEPIESERVGVCSCRVAVPGDLDHVTLSRRKNSREDFGQSIRITRPAKQGRAGWSAWRKT